MSFTNDKTAAGVVKVVPSTDPVGYVALQVISDSDLTFMDGKFQETELTAVPAGTRIDCTITQVSVCTGVVLGYEP